MKPWLPPAIVALVAAIALLAQRCSYESKLADANAASVKTDQALVTTTTELASEHIEAAKTKAKTTRAAEAKEVQDEVAHETGGDADLTSWLNERTSGD